LRASQASERCQPTRWSSMMKKRRILGCWLTLLGVILVFNLHSAIANLTATAQQTTLTLSAAASLKDALEDIKLSYQRHSQKTRIVYNFGASGSLQQQIEQGAPVDIFISAASKQMDALQTKNLLLNETRRNLLTNQLVLIVPKGSTSIRSFKQLTEPTVKRIAIGEPRSVPAGQYAEEVFKNVGILAAVKPKLVLTNNVRQVLTAVDSGNVDAGIVYLTDAATSKTVEVAAIAAEKLHSPIVYPIAVLKSSQTPQAAKTFAQYLASGEASAVFKRFKFAIAK
jgi:molybdate transport system substrate-binding protein